MKGRIAEEPNWAPLENSLGALRCVGFMFMGHVNGISCYKHGIARTYLNLDDNGNCYVPDLNGAYFKADWASELGKLEASLSKLAASLHHRDANGL